MGESAARARGVDLAMPIGVKVKLLPGLCLGVQAGFFGGYSLEAGFGPASKVWLPASRGPRLTSGCAVIQELVAARALLHLAEFRQVQLPRVEFPQCSRSGHSRGSAEKSGFQGAY